MQDPIQRSSPLIDRFAAWFAGLREEKLASLRKLSLRSVLAGVLVYMGGEIAEVESAVTAGIWLLLAGLAMALLYKGLAFFAGPGD